MNWEPSARRLRINFWARKPKLFPTLHLNPFLGPCGAGKIDSAVIPMENTLAGSVHENYDHLLHFDVRIAAETNVRIVHNLIAPPGVRFKDLRKVYSHPVALNQCHKFFARYPKLERVPFYDTAGSVKMVDGEERAGSRRHRLRCSR